MAIKGIFNSYQGVVGDRQTDFNAMILEYYPTGNAQLFAISAGIESKEAMDTTFHWYEDNHISGRVAIVSGGTTTTVTVVDGSFYIPNQVLMVEETGEHMFVTAVVGNVLTVLRGFAGTAVVSVTNAMFVQLLSSGFEEASTKPIARTQQGRPRNNLVQIFRTGWAISGTAKKIKFLTGDRLARNRQQCAMYHAEEMEKAFIFGRKHLGVYNGNQIRFTDGINTQIEKFGGIVVSAATDSGLGPIPGNYSLKDFTNDIRRIYETNVKGEPNERITYCGNIALQALNHMTIADSSYEIRAMETSVGIKVTKVTTVFGDLTLMSHPLLNENPNWTKEMYIYHPGGLKRRPYRETFPDDYDRSGTRPNGVDADEGVLTTEAGMENCAPRTMGIIRNVANGVKSTFG